MSRYQTKATIKQCINSWKTLKNSTLLFIHAPVHDGNTSIRKVE